VTVTKGPGGKRRQRTITGKTRREVEDEVARITGKVADGTYVAKWDGTVAEVLDDYLKSAAFEREANTVLSYTKALLPVRERLGQRKARSITRADIEQLRDWMISSGRRRGGKPGTGLGPRSVRLTLGRLSAAFELACMDGKLASNPCHYVRLPSQVPREDTTWSESELGRFLAAAAAGRLHACWLMSALGLRRGEVLGLKWSDISFTDGTVTIARTRVLVDGKVIVKSPKSRRSWRVLPLLGPVTSALEALYRRQCAEAEAAGPGLRGRRGRQLHLRRRARPPAAPGDLQRRVRPAVPRGGAAADQVARHPRDDERHPRAGRRGGLAARRVARPHRGRQPEELPAEAEGPDARE
jgi:integrase